MKKIIVSILLLVAMFGLLTRALAETNLMPSPTAYLTEGMALPGDYSCINYGGHNNTATMTLYLTAACTTDLGLAAIEIYRPWNGSTHEGYFNIGGKTLYIKEILVNGEYTGAQLWSHP